MKLQDKLTKWNLTQAKRGFKMTDQLKQAMTEQALEIYQAKFRFDAKSKTHILTIDAHITNDEDVKDKTLRITIPNPVISKIAVLDEIVGAKIKMISVMTTSQASNVSRMTADLIRVHSQEGKPKFVISSYNEDDYDASLSKSENNQTVAENEYKTIKEKDKQSLPKEYVETFTNK